MSRNLIRNGRIVTAVDDYIADVLLDDGRIVAIGKALDVGPGHPSHRRHRPAGLARRASTATPTWTTRSATRPPATPSSRARVRRPSAAPRRSSTSRSSARTRACSTRIARAQAKGADGGLHRLRLSRHPDRSRRAGAGRHEARDPPRGRDQLQDVHGLSGHGDGRRRGHLPGDAHGRRARRHDRAACRERHRHRAADPGGAGAGPHLAASTTR